MVGDGQLRLAHSSTWSCAAQLMITQMSIISSKTATLGRQALVLVTPTPATLSESSAILKALQNFGPVSCFLNPRYIPALRERSGSKTFLAIFSEVNALEKASQSSPLTVEVGHNEPDPAVEDPFNVRGLASRIPVKRKTFSCEILTDGDTGSHLDIVRSSPYYGSFVVDGMAISFQDLTKQGIPLPEFADVFQKHSMFTGHSGNHNGEDKKRDEELAAMSREKVEHKSQKIFRDELEDQDEKKVAKPWRRMSPSRRRYLKKARESDGG